MYNSSDVADFAVDITAICILPSVSWIYSTWNQKAQKIFQNVFFLMECTRVLCFLPEFAL